MQAPPHQVSALLKRVRAGVSGAHDELFGALYADLHDRAENLMRGQPANMTLQATALVHEAYMKLLGSTTSPAWEDRKHFLCSVSTAMRHVLVDAARRRSAAKRPSSSRRVPLEEVLLEYEERSVDVLAFDEVFRELQKCKPEMARAAELILFGGASREEAAKVLDMSQRSFERSWQFARAWIHDRLR